MSEELNVIVAASEAELVDAIRTLSRSGGGEVRLDAAGGPYTLNLSGLGSSDAPVTITALSDDTPTIIDTLNIGNSHGLTFEGLDFVPSRTWGKDIEVYGGGDIAFIDNTMTGLADGFRSETNDAVTGSTMMFVRGTTGMQFSGNTVSNYNGGIGLLDVRDVEISGNDISKLQGDGIQGRSWDNVSITDNHIHDFFGSTQSLNHTDMIQLFGTNGEFESRDVTISGNVLNSGNGAATQGILIQNEDYGHDDRTANGFYENFTITDNTIFNGSPIGIQVTQVQGLDLSNNTVLWDKDATTQMDPTKEGGTSMPFILVGDAFDISMEKNIAGQYRLYRLDESERANVSDNMLVSYNDPAADNYAYANYANLLGGSVDARDLTLRDGSVFEGYGASLDGALSKLGGFVPVMLPEIDPRDGRLVSLTAEFLEVAGQDVDTDGATFVWTFANGTVREGAEITHAFETHGVHDIHLTVTGKDGQSVELVRSVKVKDATFLSLDFENGLTDASSHETSFRTYADESDFTEGADGTGYSIGGGEKIEVARGNNQFYSLERFEISMDVKLDEAGDSGDLFTQHSIMKMAVKDDGSLSFWMKTDEGSYSVRTEAGMVSDTDWSHVAIDYDGFAGSLRFLIDGAVVAETEAYGTTSAPTIWGPVIGSHWGHSVEATVDNVFYGQRPIEIAPGATPAPEVVEERLFNFRFDDGTLNDVSAYAASVARTWGDVDAGFVSGLGHDGFAIGSGTRFDIDRGNTQLSSLDEFTLNLAFAKDTADGTGGLLTLHRTFELDLLDDGDARFWLKTDEGKFSVNAGKDALSDIDWHDLQIRYSDEDDTLELYLDGELADSTYASGTTGKMGWYHLSVGETWGKTADVTIDDLWMSRPEDTDMLV